MPYYPPSSGSLVTGTNYTSRTLTNNTGVQPNLDRPTLIHATWSMATTTNGDSGRIDLEVSPDNSVWSPACVVTHSQQNTSADHTQGHQLTAIVPPGYYYRTRNQTISGTVTFAFVSCYELTL